MHLDKAPDAFRTISEVADDLDIPQHVLRFWETRFTQIKPMKRSGGRRYYRPDDVDLLRGIRRLLYGEGYTIRGVQRILKENGVKSVQGVADGSAPAVFATAGAESGRRAATADHDAVPASPAAHDDEDAVDLPIDLPARAPVKIRREPVIAPTALPMPAASAPSPAIAHHPAPAASSERRSLDTARLETALKDLIVCRQMLDDAVRDN